MQTQAVQFLLRRARHCQIPARTPPLRYDPPLQSPPFRILVSANFSSRSSSHTLPTPDLICPRAFSTNAAAIADEITPASARPADPTVLQPRVVIYDGVCHLCHSGVKWVVKADKHKKIKFCCLQSKAAEPYLRLCGLDREDVLKRFLFIEGLHSYHQASTAALKVLCYLPFPYSAMSIFLVVPSPLRDLIYDYVAKRRYDWFGKEDRCIMPEEEMMSRFIDRDEFHKDDCNKDDS